MLRSGGERVWNTLQHTERRMEATGVKVREAGEKPHLCLELFGRHFRQERLPCPEAGN